MPCVVRDGELNGEATGWANREGHGGLAGRRIIGGMRRRAQGPQALPAKRDCFGQIRDTKMNICRSRQIDCVVLALELQDQSGFQVLVELVPIASRPRVAVVALTDRTLRGLPEIATKNGAHACFVRQFTTGNDLERAILRAMAFVGRMPKEDRFRPV